MEHGPASPRDRPRSRGISFRSDRSSGSKPKDTLVESPQDKMRRDSVWKGTSKANPNAAINEAQPAMNFELEASTLQPLGAFEHRDRHGQVITDPDRSNPTRPRLERPLETIRSFERAIDAGYKRRSSYQRAESYEQQQQQSQQQGNGQYNSSRRNSGYFGDYSNSNQPRPPPSSGGGFYGQQRPDSYYGNASASRARYGSRTQSDMNVSSPRSYPSHGYQQSQDTMNTGFTNGSDSTGPWANSTDPSSDNSSVDRINGASHHNPEHGHGYGQSSNAYASYGPAANGHGYGYGDQPPAVPAHAPVNRRPIPLGDTQHARTQAPTYSRPTPEPEKKKSWLKRRFSKNP